MLRYPIFSWKLLKLLLLKPRWVERKLNLPNYDILIVKTQFFFTVANITKKLPEKQNKFVLYTFVYIHYFFRLENKVFLIELWKIYDSLVQICRFIPSVLFFFLFELPVLGLFNPPFSLSLDLTNFFFIFLFLPPE